MSKMKQLDEIAEGIADVTMELMYDSIDWQLADFDQDPEKQIYRRGNLYSFR